MVSFPVTVLGIVIVVGILILALNVRADGNSKASTRRILSMGLSEGSHSTVYQTLPNKPMQWQREKDLHKAQDDIAQPVYGQVGIDWNLPEGDNLWRGNEEARNLSGPKVEEYNTRLPTLSYDFPNASTQRHVNVRQLKSATIAAGLVETGGGMSRTSGDLQGLSYRDMISADSLGMPNPRLLNPYLTGK